MPWYASSSDSSAGASRADDLDRAPAPPAEPRPAVAPEPSRPISPRMSSKLGPAPPVRRAIRSAAASRRPVAEAPAAAPEKNVRKKSEKPASPPVRNS